jgi:flagellar biosynthesis protein FliQ
MSHPFPALLIGTIVGIITTILNHSTKKPLNNGGVIDTQGTIITFFVPALIGGLYSAIIQAVGAYGA